MAILLSMWNKAVKGDVQAFNAVQATAGEKPVDVVQFNKDTEETIKEMEKEFKIKNG